MISIAEFTDTLRIAVGSLRSHKLRAVLTTLGIIIGVVTVISIVSIIQGLNRAFSENISALGSNILYIQKFPWFISGEDFFKYRNRKDIGMKEVKMIDENSEYVSDVSPQISTLTSIKYKSNILEDVFISGTNEKFVRTENAIPEIGRFFTFPETYRRRFVSVLGYDVAQKLFGKENPLEKEVRIKGYPFRVVGVLEKRGKLLGFNMDTIVYIPIGTFIKIFGQRRSITIRVRVKDPALMDEARDELIGLMRRARGLKPMEENDFAINQQDLLFNVYNKLTSGLWIVAIGIGSISLLVGGIGIMNIMLVSVTERTREIGIRKAVGGKRRNILLQFLAEAVTICAVGVIIGLLISLGIVLALDRSTPLPVSISWSWVVLGITFVMFIGILFGLYPAAKAARFNPIEALRYE
ncbi:MAG: ABC transporter permease [Fidelibacterota bacterium]